MGHTEQIESIGNCVIRVTEEKVVSIPYDDVETKPIIPNKICEFVHS